MNLPISASSLYERVSRVIPKAEWLTFQDDVEAILELKRRHNAVILAHNYQTPEIFHGVADIVGDSLALARKAVEVDADVIVLAGVHFMAETAKLLNPEKTVLIPDMEAGCSLAESITPEDIALLRLYDLQSGQILVDGQNIASVAQESLLLASQQASEQLRVVSHQY